MITPDDILDFWYSPPMSEHWFTSTPVIDADIRERFAALWEQAAAGELDAWQATPEGCLALCIVLDQFPLNMFRGEVRSFLYMPLMHSEHLADQDESVRLFDAAGLEANAKFARHHRDIVQRFGRFPHRNAVLGRESTADEWAYLASKEAFTG